MDLTPYSTARALMGPLQSWLTPEDAMRLGAYSLYEGIYRNVPESFRLVQRGNESNPIYLPSAKTIIEATNRFLAKDWTFVLDPQLGADADKALLKSQLEKLFRRETIRSKFKTQKRWGLVRGDQVWHIVADQNKLPGSRISVYEVDPAAYFPILDPWNEDRLLGVHLVVPVLMDDGKTVIKRQTYRKDPVSGRISYELSWWKVSAWDDRDGGKLEKADVIPEGDVNRPIAYDLDPRITAIPVYHIKNARDGGPFGTSELAGLETILAGINQSVTDEDLALSLEGLGLYATTSGPPLDENDEETNWRLGPGYVVEIDPESTFERINGISSVDPYQSHSNFLKQAAHEAQGIPDVAVGGGDVQVMESGIALAFRMAPMLSKNQEKEDEILSVTDHMLYDLVSMWMPVYEGFTTEARAMSTVGDPMPTNRKSTLEEIVLMLSTEPPLISAEYARTLISEKLGYDFPAEMMAAITKDAADLAAARNVDPFASRVAEELDAEEGGAGA